MKKIVKKLLKKAGLYDGAVLVYKIPTILNNFLKIGTVVLLYHRVFEPDIDSRLLCVAPENFRQQMIHLKENYYIYNLVDFLHDLQNSCVKNKSILITFDDGFVDNYYFLFILN